ncbi:hypothetical protein [Lysinibacillus sp. RS5]|uniref:hypothetical protein n=1 Tax=unclassified Lysinibacillus TaxID=2636778 RepID=UPI0035BE7E11
MLRLLDIMVCSLYGGNDKMKKELMNLELPELYVENLFEYRFTIDVVPEWIDFAREGYSMQKYRKFSKLYTIERMKYILNEAIQDDVINDDEMVEANKLIQEAIQEYNEMST